MYRGGRVGTHELGGGQVAFDQWVSSAPGRNRVRKIAHLDRVVNCRAMGNTCLL